MAAFAHRKWSLAAMSFALVAIAAQSLAHRHASLGMVALARATSEGAAESLRPIASRDAWCSDHWGVIGLVSALLAVGCWAGACWAGEAMRGGSLAALLVAYLVLALLMV